MKKLSLLIVVILTISFVTNAQKNNGLVAPQVVKELAQTYIDILHNSDNAYQRATKIAEISAPSALDEDGTLTSEANSSLLNNNRRRMSYLEPIKIIYVEKKPTTLYGKPADEYQVTIKADTKGYQGTFDIAMPKTGTNKVPKIVKVVLF